MEDSGFHETGAFLTKSQFFVERLGVGLGMHRCLRVPVEGGLANGGFQQIPSGVSSAVAFEDRDTFELGDVVAEAADTGSADRAIAVERYEMPACSVEPVELYVAADILFAAKHLDPDGYACLPVRVVKRFAD